VAAAANDSPSDDNSSWIQSGCRWSFNQSKCLVSAIPKFFHFFFLTINISIGYCNLRRSDGGQIKPGYDSEFLAKTIAKAGSLDNETPEINLGFSLSNK